MNCVRFATYSAISTALVWTRISSGLCRAVFQSILAEFRTGCDASYWFKIVPCFFRKHVGEYVYQDPVFPWPDFGVPLVNE